MRSFKYFNLDNIAEAELILTSIPNHDATHYLQGIYYSHWGENKKPPKGGFSFRRTFSYSGSGLDEHKSLSLIQGCADPRLAQY